MHVCMQYCHSEGGGRLGGEGKRNKAGKGREKVEWVASYPGSSSRMWKEEMSLKDKASGWVEGSEK